MKKIFYLLTVVLTLISASCSNEDVVNNDNNLITELNISIEGGAESRMGVTYDATNGFKFDWAQGDQVYVIKAEANDYSYAIFTYSSEKGKFVTGYETPLVAGEKYYAIYGQAQAINSFNESVVKASMMLGNGGTEMDNLPMLSDVFTATSEGTFATLHHLCGIVEIPVIGSGAIYQMGFNADRLVDYWYMNLNLYKGFMNNRMSLQFQVTDLFNTRKSDNCIYSGLRTMELDDEMRRTISLTFRYKFNPTKSKYKGTGAGQSQKARM